MAKIEDIYEQTLAMLADRYGKRIAYFQSLPIIKNLAKESIADAAMGKSNCPIMDDQ